MPEPQKPNDAYDAFNSVDKIVSKPVMGSDGAASWQAFRKDNNKTIYNKASSAPLAPLKKADKLGSGLKSWEDERKREVEARKETGSAGLGEGYTNFKAKNGQEEALARKEKKRIEKKIRPDKAEYFCQPKRLEGGSGITCLPPRIEGQGEESKQEKKKKKRKKAGPVILDDPNNPLEQVQAALRARNERLGLSQDGLPPGWEAAADPTTKKVYYYHRESGTRQWEKPEPETLPDGWSVAKDTSGKTYYFHRESGARQWEKPKVDGEDLPDGWSVATDQGGKTYYYHRESGKTAWEKTN